MEKSAVSITTEKYHSRSEENITHDYLFDNPFSTPHDQRSIISSAQQYSIFTGTTLLPSTSYSLSKSKSHFVYLQGSFDTYTVFILESKPLRQRKFKSARLIGEYDKPWTVKKDPRMLWDKIFFIGLTVVGLGIGAYIIYSGWASVENPPYCLIFEDDFLNGINENDWNYEIQVGGFGVGSFDWTTNDPANAYTNEKGLHIVPTITKDVTDITTEQLFNGYTLNLTSQGVCTANDAADCVRVSNITKATMINPVRSARLTTKGKHNITYGKVEVKAKLPRGDWLWPAIWMMPEEDMYGAWPLSGEIDIMESKGNDGRLYEGGRNLVGGTLHWAPNPVLDAFWRTNGVKYMTRGDYSDDYHTFGMEWSDEYIYTWVDSRLAQSMYIPFGKKYGTMYERGKFATMSVNGSIPLDPWSGTKRYNTPFDQAFYLILNVAVGSTNSYFEDGYGSKPWIDGSDTAMAQFYNASSAWESTWGEGDTRGLSVQSVKLFQRGLCTSPPK
ncbi:gram-negative bacteria binding protein, putative [Talaromyces stipitatus ATCC 10500]|uniref:Gram-negative bacteria binding protein, putative n=1 Tax=Talaromyces stipitatus (strain ATCC 10500 / CBS 375.48 / QM 6759 / NRRL 1006) TaxID=441959 RepID=B8M427_TALSN|nr:gram-negative bacteria binding protein, putative [Talaromyces stipitatus ATCC 10500]EED20770.1 gram-negative bacteria binding protein, putative [Talaromyces stipitatus ATCC 10500]